MRPVVPGSCILHEHKAGTNLRFYEFGRNLTSSAGTATARTQILSAVVLQIRPRIGLCLGAIAYRDVPRPFFFCWSLLVCTCHRHSLRYRVKQTEKQFSTEPGPWLQCCANMRFRRSGIASFHARLTKSSKTPAFIGYFSQRATAVMKCRSA